MSYQSVLKPGLFDNKTILVTGSGSGFGRCIAHELASLGANILMLGRSEDKLLTVKAEIENDNPGVVCDYGCADIREADSVETVIDKFVADHGRIHGLVNNAGGQFPADLENISPNGFLAVVRTNLLGGFIVSKAVFLKSMKEHGGNIVNITLGLPIIRTSVDHGTALHLAGTGKADSSSLIAAIECALSMAHRERALTENPRSVQANSS